MTLKELIAAVMDISDLPGNMKVYATEADTHKRIPIEHIGTCCNLLGKKPVYEVRLQMRKAKQIDSSKPRRPGFVDAYGEFWDYLTLGDLRKATKKLDDETPLFIYVDEYADQAKQIRKAYVLINHEEKQPEIYLDPEYY